MPPLVRRNVGFEGLSDSGSGFTVKGAFYQPAMVEGRCRLILLNYGVFGSLRKRAKTEALNSEESPPDAPETSVCLGLRLRVCRASLEPTQFGFRVLGVLGVWGLEFGV